MKEKAETRIAATSLRRFCASAFERLGVSGRDAAIWSDTIIETSLRGVDSHGILVLPLYLAMLQAGGIKANGTVEVIRDEGPTMVLDGQQGIGAVIADRAMNLALDRAEKFGLSFVTVRNSNHSGIAGYFAAKSLERDMVGAALTNAAPAVAAC